MRERGSNPAWRFELVNDMVIPEQTGVADMVCLFSLTFALRGLFRGGRSTSVLPTG